MKKIIAGIIVLVSLFVPALSAQSKEVAVYPNPFDVSPNGQGLKFTNLEVNSIIKIYNMQGKEICTLGPVAYTTIIWDGRNRWDQFVSPGVYYYIIFADDAKYHFGKVSVINKL